ncbi:MAG: cytochrome c-type biogenesis protein [bacterium]|nr:cytochrome c-type biogenesis protein [bacterium]
MGNLGQGLRAACAGLVIALGLVAAASPAGAARGGETTIPAPERPEDVTVDPRVAEVARELRCPICQNLSVAVSPTELATQMRALIAEKLAAGESPEAVKAYFTTKYGDWVLLRPKREGFTWLVWLLPVAGLLVGGVAVVFFTRRSMQRREDALEVVSPEPSEAGDYSRRLAREIEEFDA